MNAFAYTPSLKKKADVTLSGHLHGHLLTVVSGIFVLKIVKISQSFKLQLIISGKFFETQYIFRHQSECLVCFLHESVLKTQLVMQFYLLLLFVFDDHMNFTNACAP